MQGRKVLVTGGSGYFGSRILQLLLERGAECRSFDRMAPDECPPEVEFFQGDILDLQAIKKACEGVSIVYHNVAQLPLAKNTGLFERVNVQGTEVMCQAALETGVEKVVATSTCAIYGAPKRNPVTEKTPPSPGESYGRTKYESELVCYKYRDKGMDISILRPDTIVGTGRLGIFQILFEWLYEGRNIPVFGKGGNLYQFIHGDDFAEVSILASLRQGSEDYNCGTDRFGTMRELMEHLCEHAGTGSRVRNLPATPMVWGMKFTSALGMSPLGAYHSLMFAKEIYFDITKAKSELGWQPKYSNNEMFAQNYDWYLESREAILSSPGVSEHTSAVKEGILAIVKRLL